MTGSEQQEGDGSEEAGAIGMTDSALYFCPPQKKESSGSQSLEAEAPNTGTGSGGGSGGSGGSGGNGSGSRRGGGTVGMPSDSPAVRLRGNQMEVSASSQIAKRLVAELASAVDAGIDETTALAAENANLKTENVELKAKVKELGKRLAAAAAFVAKNAKTAQPGSASAANDQRPSKLPFAVAFGATEKEHSFGRSNIPDWIIKERDLKLISREHVKVKSQTHSDGSQSLRVLPIKDVYVRTPSCSDWQKRKSSEGYATIRPGTCISLGHGRPGPSSNKQGTVQFCLKQIEKSMLVQQVISADRKAPALLFEYAE